MNRVVSAGVFSIHKACESHLSSDLQLELRTSKLFFLVLGIKCKANEPTEISS